MVRKRPPIYKRKLLVDRQLQFTLIVYALMMAGVGIVLAALFTLLLTYTRMTNVNTVSGTLVLVTSAAIANLIVIFLGLYVTNKIAGPITRLKNAMLEVASGSNPTPLVSRDNDLISKELFESYNKLIERIPKQ